MLSGVYDLNMLHQLPNSETNLMIPSDLATMERLCGTTSEYNIVFMTSRIAGIVTDVQEEKKRTGHLIGRP